MLWNKSKLFIIYNVDKIQIINQLKTKNMKKLSYKVIKEYKGLQLVKTNIEYKGDFYGVRCKVERKAKMGLTFEEALNVFYHCIK